MARTSRGAELTSAHRRLQLGVRAQALLDFSKLWPLWRGDQASFMELLDVTAPLARGHHQLSKSLAASYYRDFRGAEGVGGSPSPVLAESLDDDRLKGTLFLTGHEMTAKSLAAGQRPEVAMETALARMSGTVTRFVLEGGRETLVRSAAADKRARGVTRITSGNPCDFCASLVAITDDFAAHDHCGCMAEVAYG